MNPAGIPSPAARKATPHLIDCLVTEHCLDLADAHWLASPGGDPPIADVRHARVTMHISRELPGIDRPGGGGMVELTGFEPVTS